MDTNSESALLGGENPPHQHSAEQVVAWRSKHTVTREAIWGQLERILATPLFSNSKRFPAFLSYVVAHVIDQGDGSLKERRLGVEVFGRVPDYDTAQDPVVRMTAVEIRKRLAQYYSTPGHEDELRIELAPGSYMPAFYPAPGTAAYACEETRRRPEASSDRVASAWNTRHNGSDLNHARRLHEVEQENRRLRQLVADLSLEREALKAVLRNRAASHANGSGSERRTRVADPPGSVIALR
jgi:hypothetical protein